MKLDPKPRELIMNRLKDRTSVCCNKLGRFVIRGERLIKRGYSWFSMKPISVGHY